MTAIRILVMFLREDQHLDETLRRETLKHKISKISVSHLEQICRIIDIDPSDIPKDGRQKRKMPFVDAILSKVGCYTSVIIHFSMYPYRRRALMIIPFKPSMYAFSNFLALTSEPPSWGSMF